MKLEEQNLKKNLPCGSRKDNKLHWFHDGAGWEHEADCTVSSSGIEEENQQCSGVVFRLDPAFPSSYTILLSGIWKDWAHVEYVCPHGGGYLHSLSAFAVTRVGTLATKTCPLQVSADETGCEKHAS